MTETKKERAARYAGYERRRLEGYAPPLRVLITKDEGELLERIRRRRGIGKAAFPAALLRAALPLEMLGGDAVAVLERALEETTGSEGTRAG